MELTPTETAYLAGIFDGEGCIMIDKRKPYVKRGKSPIHILRIQITNTSKPLLDWLDKLGFYVRRIKAKPRSGMKIIKDWGVASITHNKARDVLLQMLPYLIVKRQEAEVAIEFQNHKNEISSHFNFKLGLNEAELQYRESTRERLKALKHEEASNEDNGQ